MSVGSKSEAGKFASFQPNKRGILSVASGIQAIEGTVLLT